MDRVLVVIPAKYEKFLDEEISLVKTVYKDIVETMIIRRPNTKYYVSMNKLEYVKNNSVDKIIVMDRLKPSQVINLTRETGKEVIDRVLLILEVFQQHAGSLEAKLQIELAQLKHQLPLVKEAIRYAKIGELHGYLGAGRYGYEKYYTMLKMREAKIRRELEKLRKMRMTKRLHRMKIGFPHIAIVGYTCAGKTTLFNRLTNSNKPVGPEPFTTLSPKASRIRIGERDVIVIDTVGFIRDLPHEIIEAFYATLEEILFSNIIVNVVDASKTIDRILNDIYETRRILSHIGVQGKPVIIALNKIDLVDESELHGKVRNIESILESNELLITISAEKNINIDKLVDLMKIILEDKENGENIRSKIWA